MSTPTENQTPPEAPQGANWVHRIVRLPSVERGCTGKTNLGRNYEKQADRLSAKRGKQYGVYRCPHCGGTHLTTKLFKADQYPEMLYVTPPNAGAEGRREPLPTKPGA